MLLFENTREVSRAAQNSLGATCGRGKMHSTLRRSNHNGKNIRLHVITGE